MLLLTFLVSLSLINALPADVMIAKRGFNLNIFSKFRSNKVPQPIRNAETPRNLGKPLSSSSQSEEVNQISSQLNEVVRKPFSPPTTPNDGTILGPKSPVSASTAQLSKRPRTKVSHKPKFTPKLDTIHETASGDATDMILKWKSAEQNYLILGEALEKIKKKRDGTEKYQPHIQNIELVVLHNKAIADSLNPKILAQNYAARAEAINLQAKNLMEESNFQMQQVFRETIDPKLIYAAVKKRQEQMLAAQAFLNEAQALSEKAMIAKEAQKHIS